VKHAHWYVRGEDEPVFVPRPAPAIRGFLLRSGVVAVALCAWAVVERTWVPLLALVPPLILGGPVPWRRAFLETRAGSALFQFLCADLAALAVFWSVDSLVGVITAVFVGIGGLSGWFVWKGRHGF
jgi:hypothetical protein